MYLWKKYILPYIAKYILPYFQTKYYENILSNMLKRYIFSDSAICFNIVMVFVMVSFSEQNLFSLSSFFDYLPGQKTGLRFSCILIGWIAMWHFQRIRMQGKKVLNSLPRSRNITDINRIAKKDFCVVPINIWKRIECEDKQNVGRQRQWEYMITGCRWEYLDCTTIYYWFLGTIAPKNNSLN